MIVQLFMLVWML